MTYLWYVVAALGAGISTGLVGLSAAAVMVPILIVLCGVDAYHATAISLASDVIASLVSSLVYIRHKNIDLKRSWMLLISVVVMCVVGSLVAWYVGNVTLGYFSLILCVFIGIRFIIQPDPKSRNLAEKGSVLDRKSKIISVLLGMVIGFIVGFVGSGGGIMMLLVFTMFLGMERRTAVGTSTFIMTLTALIAFGSHAVIDNNIILDQWQALAVCVPVATVGAVVSSLFANKVNNKVVGLVTGITLTVLGLVLIVLHFFF